VLRLEERINQAVINRIIQDMADITTPLKQFTDAVLAQEAAARKREMVEQRGQALKQFSTRLSKTANIVASANARTKRRAKACCICPPRSRISLPNWSMLAPSK